MVPATHAYAHPAPAHHAHQRTKEQRNNFLRLYFMLVMLYGLIGFLHGLLIRNDPRLIKYVFFTHAVGVLSFVFVLYSLAALFYFREYRFRGLVFILPWYYVIFQSLLIAINYTSVFQGFVLQAFEPGIVHIGFTALGLVTSLFEFFFAFYVIQRLELFG